MKAIRFHKTGGPEVLQYDDVPLPEPGPNEIRVKIAAIGVNYIDTYFRSGLYPTATLPHTPGIEAAGTVDARGSSVKSFQFGEPVAFATARGASAYAQYAIVPEDQLLAVPQNLDLTLVAASLLQGMTAHFLSHSTYPLQPSRTALIHAAAGGVGLLLVQIAKMLEAKVIATTSTAEKAALATKAGADHVILYTQTDFLTEVQRLTQNQGVHVVYDAVGKTTFDKSLASLQPRGMLVLYGQASGKVAPFDPTLLANQGSLFLTRPTLFDYTRTREELTWRAAAVFDWLLNNQLDVRIDRQLALSEANIAHQLLQSRQTAGKLVLIPD